MLLSRVLRHDTLQSIPFSSDIINKCNLSGANHALKPCRIAAGHICFIHFVVCIELKSCMMSLFNQIYFSAFCSPMEIENPCSIGFFITEIQRNNIDFTSTSAAADFAAKEAFLKAAGTGLRLWRF